MNINNDNLAQHSLPTKPAATTQSTLTKTEANELKHITKNIRETNYIITQSIDLETITNNLIFKQYLLETRNKIISKFTTTIDIGIQQLAADVLTKNQLKQARRYDTNPSKETDTPKAPIVKQQVSIMAHPTLALATKGNTKLKATHHHYPGFYSSTVLPPCERTVEIKTADNVAPVIGHPRDLAVNYGYSGSDTIIAVQPTMMIRKEIAEDIPQGSIVTNFDTKQPIGLITGKIEMNEYNAYPIQNGFRETNIHLNTRVTRTIKTKPIIYADKQFDTKQELNEYITSLPDNPSNFKATLVTDEYNRNTQLVLHTHGHMIANIQLRHRLCDKYKTQNVAYKPYETTTMHESGF